MFHNILFMPKSFSLFLKISSFSLHFIIINFNIWNGDLLFCLHTVWFNNGLCILRSPILPEKILKLKVVLIWRDIYSEKYKIGAINIMLQVLKLERILKWKDRN